MFTCLSKLHNSIYSFLQFSRRKEIFKKKNANKPNLPGVSQNVIQHNWSFDKDKETTNRQDFACLISSKMHFY